TNPAPNPFPQYTPDGPINDGSTHPTPAKSGTGGLVPGSDAGQNATTQSATTSVANTPAEQGFLAELVGPAIGASPHQFPGWGSELIGPLFRGTEVTIK